MEISHSINFIREQLSNLPSGSIWSQPEALAPNALAVTLIEGWRGRIAHLALTDERGAFLRYKIVDPSFFNWLGLALAMREQQISDFPLCNKSFNLSYCGHDL
jgi:Ni,Fe-hydrogenase III large subunit